MSALQELDDRLREAFVADEKLREACEQVLKEFGDGVFSHTVAWAALMVRFEERLAKEQS